MSKARQHFATHGHAGMRLAWLSGVRTTSPYCLASRARIGFAPTRSYAKVFHPATGRQWTAADNLPQLPQPALKKLGQRKANRYAVPRLPQPAPPVFDKGRAQSEAAARCVVAGRESNSRRKTLQPCNFNGSSLAYPLAGNPHRVIFLGCDIQNIVNSLQSALQLVALNAKR